jgi:outer membrane immunogenic protein
MTVLLRPAPVALALLSAAAASAAAQSRNSYPPAYVAPQPVVAPRPLEYAPRSGMTYRDGSGYRPARSDLGHQQRQPYAMPSIWSGLYMGAHGSYGWGRTAANHADLGNIDTRGGLAGIHVGYNWQNAQLVYGLEGDLSVGGPEGRRTFPVSGLDAESRARWTTSVRGRLGYAFTSMMIYATGGFAFASHDFSLNDGLTSMRVSETHLGYVVGAGLEWKVAPQMSLRGEALHYSFGEKSYDFAGDKVPTRLDNTIVRAGLTFHLN